MNISQFKEEIFFEDKRNAYLKVLDEYKISHKRAHSFLFKKINIRIELEDRVFEGILSINLLSLILGQEPFTTYRSLNQKLKKCSVIVMATKSPFKMAITIKRGEEDHLSDISKDLLEYFSQKVEQ